MRPQSGSVPFSLIYNLLIRSSDDVQWPDVQTPWKTAAARDFDISGHQSHAAGARFAPVPGKPSELSPCFMALRLSPFRPSPPPLFSKFACCEPDGTLLMRRRLETQLDRSGSPKPCNASSPPAVAWTLDDGQVQMRRLNRLVLYEVLVGVGSGGAARRGRS